MKKLIYAISIFTISMCMTANAAALDNISSVWDSLTSTAMGGKYTTAPSAEVSSREQWLEAVNNAAASLYNEITLTINNYSNEEYDIKQLYAYDYILRGKGTIIGSKAQITYNMTYSSNYKLRRALESKELISRLNTEELWVYNHLIKTTRELTAGLSTDYEKELAIHDYIISTYRYGGIDNDGNASLRAHEAAALVTQGEGVCEAYSELFYFMGKCAGLDVGFATGTSDGVPHMWNTIRLDGEYYHVDCTSDDPSPDVPGRTRYNYFNLSTEMILKDHTFDNKEGIDCSGTKYNYYTYNNYIVRSGDELADFISRQYDSGLRTITFRTEGYTINSATIIRNILAEKGCKSFGLVGEYGKDGIFTIITNN